MKVEDMLPAKPKTTTRSTRPDSSHVSSASVTSSRRPPPSASGRKSVTSYGGKLNSARPMTSAAPRPRDGVVTSTTGSKTFFTVTVRSKFLTEAIMRPNTSRSRAMSAHTGNGSFNLPALKPRRGKKKQKSREKSDSDYYDDGEQTIAGASRDVTTDDDVRQAGVRQLNAMFSARSQLDDIFNDLTDNVTALGRMREKPLPTGSNIFEEVLHELVHLTVTPEPSLEGDDVAPVLDPDLDPEVTEPLNKEDVGDEEEEEEEEESQGQLEDGDKENGEYSAHIEQDASTEQRVENATTTDTTTQVTVETTQE